MTSPTEAEARLIAKGLTKAQREAVLACRKRSTGANGEWWDFSFVAAGTRKALMRNGVASPWGMVSASLTPIGLAVRRVLEAEASSGSAVSHQQGVE